MRAVVRVSSTTPTAFALSLFFFAVAVEFFQEIACCYNFEAAQDDHFGGDYEESSLPQLVGMSAMCRGVRCQGGNRKESG
jgi:hypothetical protein